VIQRQEGNVGPKTVILSADEENLLGTCVGNVERQNREFKQSWQNWRLSGEGTPRSPVLHQNTRITVYKLDDRARCRKATVVVAASADYLGCADLRQEQLHDQDIVQMLLEVEAGQGTE
jgi:hypothetical protein